MQEINLKNVSPEIAAYISSLENQISSLKEKNEKAEKELQRLQSLNEQLIKMKKTMFGQKSEQIQYIDGTEQISFFNEAELNYSAGEKEPTEDTLLVKEHFRKPKRTKEEMIEGLEHKKILCEINGDELKCDICGSELEKIGEKFIRSELIIIPEQMYVADYYASSYKCNRCGKETDEDHIIQARTPVPVMKKSMASAASVAYVMQEKFVNGVPLYRQSEYWKNRGVNLNRNTLANWIIRSSLWFKPLWELMREELVSSEIINADETECQVLKEDGRKAEQMSRMWVFCSKEKNIALYRYDPTRRGKVAIESLEGFKGYLQTDGYSGYNQVNDVIRVGCLAHARRKWTDCFPKGVDQGSSLSKTGLEYMEKIFAEEKKLEGLEAEEKKEKRNLTIKPLFDEYFEFLDTFEASNGSNLYKAQIYSLNQKENLYNILLNGNLDLTNNLAERAVKPFVMSRKNFLFSDTSKGAESSAMCFTMIETAKRNNLDPFGYLMYLLQELPRLGENPSKDNLLNLLPWSDKIPDYCKLNR